MTQELVWLLCNDLDYNKAAQIPLVSRFPFYEWVLVFLYYYCSYWHFSKLLRLNSLIHKEVKAELLAASKEDPKKCQMIENMFDPKWKALALTEGRRFIKSHLPLSLLPPDLSKGTCKVHEKKQSVQEVLNESKTAQCTGWSNKTVPSQ